MKATFFAAAFMALQTALAFPTVRASNSTYMTVSARTEEPYYTANDPTFTLIIDVPFNHDGLGYSYEPLPGNEGPPNQLNIFVIHNGTIISKKRDVALKRDGYDATLEAGTVDNHFIVEFEYTTLAPSIFPYALTIGLEHNHLFFPIQYYGETLLYYIPGNGTQA